MTHPRPDPRVLHAAVLEWYAGAARDLPWRRADASPWAVLVSEFMLQQTPVARVLPVYDAWMARWPTAATLAAEPSGEAVRAWGRLGYPRRALRLHAAARALVERHSGQVPRSYEALRALPGVGDYTAGAVLSFAYGGRHAVLDTNVRRVFGRVLDGQQFPGRSVTRTERCRAEELLPEGDTAARWAAATMELGALVCTAATPACERCPVSGSCAWRSAGRPAGERPRPQPGYQGSDRQVRGILLAVLRGSTDPVSQSILLAECPEPAQAHRCLAGLVADGLAYPAASQEEPAFVLSG